MNTDDEDLPLTMTEFNVTPGKCCGLVCNSTVALNWIRECSQTLPQLRGAAC